MTLVWVETGAVAVDPDDDVGDDGSYGLGGYIATPLELGDAIAYELARSGIYTGGGYQHPRWHLLLRLLVIEPGRPVPGRCPRCYEPEHGADLSPDGDDCFAPSPLPGGREPAPPSTRRCAVLTATGLPSLQALAGPPSLIGGMIGVALAELGAGSQPWLRIEATDPDRFVWIPS